MPGSGLIFNSSSAKIKIRKNDESIKMLLPEVILVILQFFTETSIKAHADRDPVTIHDFNVFREQRVIQKLGVNPLLNQLPVQLFFLLFGL